MLNSLRILMFSQSKENETHRFVNYSQTPQTHAPPTFNTSIQSAYALQSHSILPSPHPSGVLDFQKQLHLAYKENNVQSYLKIYVFK